MGLDIVLGLVILVGAIRGWLRGFMTQAIRLGGLVGSVYAAAPVRDQVRPYVRQYLASIRPDLLDRLLWWASALLVYVVSVGLASVALKMYRRRPFDDAEPNRTDQFAGFLLGAVKATVFVTFLTAGLSKYAVDRVKEIDWAAEQARDSYALKWDGQHRPAAKVWDSVPVQHFVGEIRRMGLQPSTAAEPTAEPRRPDVQPPPVQAATAPTPPRLDLPRLDPGSAEFAHDFDRIFETLTPDDAPRD